MSQMSKKMVCISKAMDNFNKKIFPALIPDRQGIYIVGGSLRDAMLGHSPKDYDIVVRGDARPVAEGIARQAGSRVIPIGKPGLTTYRVIAGTHTLDIAPAEDGELKKDLKRRDFTINAMAFDLHSETIHDPCSGLSDLKAGIVRMNSPAVLKADPLRLLRAFRMAAALGFQIAPETIAGIKKNAPAIKSVAKERVRDEWIKLLETPESFPHLLKMDDTGLMAALFPELQQLKNCPQNDYHDLDAFDHTLQVFRHLEQALTMNAPRLSHDHANADLVNGPSGNALIKHTALFHDIGKPAAATTREDGKIRFYGHETTGAQMTEAISGRIGLSNAQKNYAAFIVRHHLRPLFLYTANSEGRRNALARTRFFIKTTPFTTDLLLLAAADMQGKRQNGDACGFKAFVRDTLEHYHKSFYPKYSAPPLVTGDDLIGRFGLTPSPLFAEILDKIEFQRLAGHIETRDKALAFVDNYIKSKMRP